MSFFAWFKMWDVQKYCVKSCSETKWSNFIGLKWRQSEKSQQNVQMDGPYPKEMNVNSIKISYRQKMSASNEKKIRKNGKWQNFYRDFYRQFFKSTKLVTNIYFRWRNWLTLQESRKQISVRVTHTKFVTRNVQSSLNLYGILTYFSANKIDGSKLHL